MGAGGENVPGALDNDIGEIGDGLLLPASDQGDGVDDGIVPCGGLENGVEIANIGLDEGQVGSRSTRSKSVSS